MPEPQSDAHRPRGIIFDLDGTLVDTVETRIRAWLAVFAESGIPATHDQLAPLIGADGRRLAREVAAAAGIELATGRDEEIDRRSGEIYGEINHNPAPLPGVRELLAELDRRGLPWAVGTSSRAAQVSASIAALGLERTPRVVDGSHVAHAKPAPDLLLLAARELGVSAGHAWYVGDSTWDMAAAVAAGMHPVAVTAGAAVSADTLRDAGAAWVVDRIDRLLARLPEPG
jgi:HAD superfamily hydrolase (TIGR01509 family)